jgi:thiamine pyrophosphate-dependent acetolactate synthase large subunit-like protein
MKIKAHDLVGRALKKQGVDTAFFLMGGPMLGAMASCIDQGVRMIDVRHEQAAAFMAQAYARLRARPGVCMAASGPGAINLTTGLANALIDCAPVVALGGASPVGSLGRGAFQEIDQVAIMRPVTKWAERVYDPKRIPELIDVAFRQAMSGKPGPVYLDLPGDVLHMEVEEEAIAWPAPGAPEAVARPAAPPEAIARAVALLQEAERPIVITGSGILYSQASRELQAFVEAAGVPIYTTPQGRGVVPDDHEYSYPRMRSTALREADLVFVVGTRLNYVIGHGRPPRFSPNARLVRIDIDPAEANAGGANIALGICADARTALAQLTEALRGRNTPARFADWRGRLSKGDKDRIAAGEEKLSNSQTPVHPLRLCKEVRDFMDREAIVVVDGQEILNFGRQSINTFFPGHRLNSGPFGTMGVGLPFGVGAKAAKPDAQVIVLHGDGSFGLNAMELDTAVRHRLPILVVISLNGGWTADPDGKKPGRNLGYTRYDRMAEALGCHAEYVESPDGIRPALERAQRAVKEGKVALVNVVTDSKARAQTADFTAYTT